MASDTPVPATMQAITFSKYGDSSVLEHGTVATPLFSDKNTHCILVRVQSAGVNPADYKVRKGDMATMVKMHFPAIPGLDYAGVVAAVHSGYSGPLKVGDRVYGKTAEMQDKARTKLDLVVPLPDNVSFNDAGGVAVVALTAYVGLVPYGGLSKDDAENAGRRVLVIGASGGVGMFVVQMAKLLGAHVTAVASGKNKDFVVNTLKAETFVDYTLAPLAEQLSTKNEFDVIYDVVAGDDGKNWELAQTILKPSGLFVSPVPPFDGPVSMGNMTSMMGTLAWRAVSSSRRYKFISSSRIERSETEDRNMRKNQLQTPETTPSKRSRIFKVAEQDDIQEHSESPSLEGMLDAKHLEESLTSVPGPQSKAYLDLTVPQKHAGDHRIGVTGPQTSNSSKTDPKRAGDQLSNASRYQSQHSTAINAPPERALKPWDAAAEPQSQHSTAINAIPKRGLKALDAAPEPQSQHSTAINASPERALKPLDAAAEPQ
ncbi:hypothetical protein HDU77_000429, partial [Chytriomyces hyalinus]